MNDKNTPTEEVLKNQLSETVRFLHSQGWAPATSSNYSFRVPGQELFWISRSGVDKAHFTPAHLMLIDRLGKPVHEPDARSSAETLLHLLIYEEAGVGAVLHTHTVNNTVLSLAHQKEGAIRFTNYELLKGLQGIGTHEHELVLPIFANSQDMTALSAEIRAYRTAHPNMHGFLLAGHGLYTWGASIAEAKRHVEVFEFLFDCTLKLKLYGYSQHT